MRWMLGLVLGTSGSAWAVGTVEASDPEAGVRFQQAPVPCDGEVHRDADGKVVSCDPVSTEFLALDTPNLPPASKDLDKALKKASRKAEKASKKAKKAAKQRDRKAREAASGPTDQLSTQGPVIHNRS